MTSGEINKITKMMRVKEMSDLTIFRNIKWYHLHKDKFCTQERPKSKINYCFKGF